MAWTNKGNMKGPPASGTGIPDPLSLNEIHVNVQVYIGARARLVALPNGVKLEIQDSGGVWHLGNSWTI